MLLRIMTMKDFCAGNDNITKLPIQFEGTFPACVKYAEEHGYIWKPCKTMLFGGYYKHTTTRDILFPDVEPS